MLLQEYQPATFSKKTESAAPLLRLSALESEAPVCKSARDGISLELSKVHFHSKLQKVSHAINHPFLPPLVSPVHDKVQRMQHIIDDALDALHESDSPNSPVKNAKPVYMHDKHQPVDILRVLFKSLQVQQEKLGFTVLKLVDLFLEKGVPEVMEALFLGSVQRIVSKSLQSHHGNQQLFQVMRVADMREKFFKLFPIGEKFITDSISLGQSKSH